MSTFFSSLTGIEFDSPSNIIYTRAIPVSFSPTFSGAPLSSLNIPYQQVWNFGDGIYSYETVPTHTFFEQGIFPVSYTVFLPNSAVIGIIDEIKTITAFVSVFNYVDDDIEWTNGTSSTFQSLPQTIPFTISLSSSNVENQPSVQLYSRGSRAQPWQIPQSKWSHLKPQWRFIDLSGNFIDIVTLNNFTTITIDASGNRTFDGSGFVVGTSATFQCFYIDDFPTQDLDNIVNSVTLVATLITSGYNFENDDLKYAPSYSNSGVSDITNHIIKYLFPDHLEITTNGITPLNNIIWKNAYTPYTITVHPSAPNDDIILKNFPQSNFIVGSFSEYLSAIPGENIIVNGDFQTGDYTAWTLSGSEEFFNSAAVNPFNDPNFGEVMVADYSGLSGLYYITQNLPTVPNTIYQIIVYYISDGLTPNDLQIIWGDDIVLDSGPLPSYGQLNPIGTTVVATSSNTIIAIGTRDDPGEIGISLIQVFPITVGAEFQNDDLILSRFDSDGFDTGGYARNAFYPLGVSNDAVLTASMSASFTFFNQSFGAWVSNPYFNQIMFLTIDNSYTGTQFISAGFGVPNSQVFGIARVTGNVDDNAWMTDPTNDKIYFVTRSFGVEDTIDLRTTPQLSAYFISSNNNLTPTGIALDNNQDVWITLFDAVSTIKLDGITGDITHLAVPPTLSFYLSSPGISGFGGEQLVTPTKVDTDTLNNIWVAYNHPLSSFLCKYDSTGTFITQVDLPLFSKPYDLIIDKQNNIWVTLSYSIDSLSGAVVQYDSTGTLVQLVTAFNSPSYITLDFEQNPWFVHNYNFVTQISATNYNTVTYLMSSDTLMPDPSANIYRWGLFDQELGGISVDWFNQIWVLNSYDNRIYRISTTDSLSTVDTPIQITPFIDNFQYSLQAYGDWQGVQWFNKYSPIPLSALDQAITLNLSGISNPFQVVDFSNFYDIRKINENFDGVNKIRNITLQNNIKNNDILFNNIIAPIAGTLDNDPLTIGTAVYEKISNFVGNQGDIDTCNIHQLYSLHQLINLPIDDHQLEYPSDVQRILDLLSLNLTKLKPTRSKFANDFQKVNINSSGVNIGKLLDTSTYMVTAGVDIVVNTKFSNYFEHIQTMPINSDVLLVPELSAYYSTFPLSAFPLSVYPLSAFYGWGLSIPVDEFYFFYPYLSGFNNEQVEGVIDWSNPHTTLTENITSIDEFYKDGGIVDTIFNYYLFTGLGLISS